MDKDNTRKLSIIIIIISLFILFTFTGCFSPFQGDGAVIAINLGGAGRSITQEEFNKLIHTIEFSGPNGARYTVNVPQGQSSVSETVSPGRWQISVFAEKDGLPYAEGSETEDIRPGNNQITIWMNLISLKIISNSTDLGKIGDDPDWPMSGYYILDSNISLPGSNWTPIGTAADPFTGTLDGAGFTITGLTITDAANNQGLFGQIGVGGVVKNLGFIGVNIKTDFNDRVNIGGIAGINRGTIQNCYVTGTLNPQGTLPIPRGTNIAAIAGLNYGIVKNCYSTADVTSRFAPNDPINNPCAGGIVGRNEGIVENCFATGTITSEPNGPPTRTIFGGGIVGTHNSGTVSNCVALNNSILGGTGSPYSLYRVVGYGTGLTNNYGLENMMVGITADGGSNKTATGMGGEDVSAAQAATQSWWTGASGLGWAWGSSESAPWKWNSTLNRPELWFE